MNYRMVAILLVCGALASCGGSGSSGGADDQAASPNTDRNSNGIRDSVEASLAQAFSSDTNKNALALVVAVDLERLLAPIPADVAEAQKMLTRTSPQLRCARSRVPAADVEEVMLQVRSMTFDTAARQDHIYQLTLKAGSFEMDQSIWADEGSTC